MSFYFVVLIGLDGFHKLISGGGDD